MVKVQGSGNGPAPGSKLLELSLRIVIVHRESVPEIRAETRRIAFLQKMASYRRFLARPNKPTCGRIIRLNILP